ncbi:DUF115 domain-containing protein, partial [Campylobacter lari]|nr:DUF115 domain-containing protein [Campylobacter lari]
MNKELFLKNTQALFEVDQILAYELRKINQILNFKFMQDKIYSLQHQIYIMQNNNFDNNKFELYPVLFFYGFGDGLFYKNLLKNPN